MHVREPGLRKPHPRLLAVCASGLALLCFGQALWIHAKADVAQVSIETARERTLARPDLPQKEDLYVPASDSLTLVTCHPFDAAFPGGPLRYVVTALKYDF
jgi:hypothetical protein